MKEIWAFIVAIASLALRQGGGLASFKLLENSWSNIWQVRLS